jgi:hypothetical protein
VPHDEQEHARSETERASGLPSGVVALILATLAAAAFIVDGHLAVRRGGQSCDGGTCLVLFYVGLAKGALAWILGFPSAWLAISLFRRLSRWR